MVLYMITHAADETDSDCDGLDPDDIDTGEQIGKKGDRKMEMEELSQISSPYSSQHDLSDDSDGR